MKKIFLVIILSVFSTLFFTSCERDEPDDSKRTTLKDRDPKPEQPGTPNKPTEPGIPKPVYK